MQPFYRNGSPGAVMEGFGLRLSILPHVLIEQCDANAGREPSGTRKQQGVSRSSNGKADRSQWAEQSRGTGSGICASPYQRDCYAPYAPISSQSCDTSSAAASATISAAF